MAQLLPAVAYHYHYCNENLTFARRLTTVAYHHHHHQRFLDTCENLILSRFLVEECEDLLSTFSSSYAKRHVFFFQQTQTVLLQRRRYNIPSTENNGMIIVNRCMYEAFRMMYIHTPVSYTHLTLPTIYSV